MHIKLTIILFLAALSVHASEVYRQVDPEGNVLFSDKKTEGREKVNIPPANVVKSFKPEAEPTKKDEDKTNKTETRYLRLLLLHPGNDATVRDAPGNVKLEWQVEPPLETKQNHSFEILLDNTIVARNIEQPLHTLTNINRGTHTVQIRLVNARQEILISSQTSVFHLHRFSRLHRAPK